MRAFHRDKAPFNQYYYIDICEDNINAIKQRTGNRGNVHVRVGDSNILVTDLVKRLKSNCYRYHFAYIDPFGPEALKFNTIKELASLDRMDMLINFPIGPIKRNISIWMNKTNSILDEFMGTNTWRDKVRTSSGSGIYSALIDLYKNQLLAAGYPEKGLRMIASDKSLYSGLPVVPIRNTKDVELYVLILAAKHELAQKMWNSAIKVSPDGQRSLF